MQIELSLKNIVIGVGLISAACGNVFYIGKLYSDFELFKDEIADIKANQNILELNNLGYFKNSKNVIEIGSQNLHLNFADLKDLFEIVGLDNNVEETHPDVKNWPFSPKCESKYLWKAIGINDYECIDVDGENNAIIHDLNKPFEDKSKFNKFDIVTDFGSCEHVFNISECEKNCYLSTCPSSQEPWWIYLNPYPIAP